MLIFQSVIAEASTFFRQNSNHALSELRQPPYRSGMCEGPEPHTGLFELESLCIAHESSLCTRSLQRSALWLFHNGTWDKDPPVRD